MKAVAKSLFDEFKAFAFKGNVVDLAVGVIVGAAFGKIVDSFVKHIVMPLLGVILPGDQGYTGWKLTVNGQDIPYGLFIGEIVNFLLVAFALFIFTKKFLSWLSRSRSEEQSEIPQAPSLSKDQELLVEIRDILRAQRNG